MTAKELYETTYQKKQHFSFGQNWKSFLETLDNNKITQAKKSLADFLGGVANIRGKTFVDIGCGSGLSSLAAHLLGAQKVVSVDVDDSSLWCANFLKKKYAKKSNWSIIKGSILNQKFVSSLGKYDIVYSWGVLHHTGNMYQALDSILRLVKSDGLLYLAIYNKTTSFWQGGSSLFWLKIKQLFNSSSQFKKTIIVYLFAIYQILGLILVARVNPFRYLKNYSKDRGMSWKHDLLNWLGGYPYEFALPEEIINYFSLKNFFCLKLKARNGIGCNEYLFRQN